MKFFERFFKIFLAINFVIFAAANARENPFMPQVKIEKPSELQNEVEFGKLAFSFPKDARKLTRVKLEYLAMDGGIKTHLIDVQQPIDWHKNYMLISENEFAKNKLEAEKIKQEKLKQLAGANEKIKQDFEAANAPKMAAPEANIAPKVAEIKRAPDAQKEESDNLKIVENNGKELIKINDKVNIIVRADSVKINTPGKLVRQFTLNHPDRIVLDFSPIAVRSAHTFPLLNSSFDSLLIGIHRDFYRVVLHTDSKYDYELSYDAQGCLIQLK